MKKNDISKYLCKGSLLCAAIAAVLQVVAVLISFESGTNYFTRGAIFPVIAVCFAILGTVLGIVSAFLSDPIAPETATVFPDRVRIPSTMVGFLVAGGFLLYYTCRDLPAFVLSQLAYTDVIGLVGGIMLLLGAVYVLATALPGIRKRGSLVAGIGFFAVIGTLFLNAYYYFDFSVEMNAPLKTATQIGLICASVYFTGELRFLLGRQLPRAFAAYCTTVISLGSLCSLSLLVALFFDKMERADYTAGALLVFCTILTALVRLATLKRPSAPQEQEPEMPVDPPMQDENNEVPQ